MIELKRVGWCVIEWVASRLGVVSEGGLGDKGLCWCTPLGRPTQTARSCTFRKFFKTTLWRFQAHTKAV